MNKTSQILAQVKRLKWFRSRPKAVQARILTHPPGIYRMKSTNHVVVMYAYTERLIEGRNVCETCQVLVLRQHNPKIAFERRVFDVPFTDLESLEN